jgi:hypothetical protein
LGSSDSNNLILHPFVYVLSSSDSGQLHNQREYIQHQYDSTEQNKNKQQNKQKMYQFRLLTLKEEFLKISVSLHTA